MRALQAAVAEFGLLPSSRVMRYIHPLLGLFALAFTLMLPLPLSAQPDASRLDELERRVTRAEHRSRGDQAAGVAMFVCAAFCALWAQQTARHAWLWFFLGLLFSVITLLVLLYKNSNDKRGGG
jgi:hypothetical protein